MAEIPNNYDDFVAILYTLRFTVLDNPESDYLESGIPMVERLNGYCYQAATDDMHVYTMNLGNPNYLGWGDTVKITVHNQGENIVNFVIERQRQNRWIYTEGFNWIAQNGDRLCQEEVVTFINDSFKFYYRVNAADNEIPEKFNIVNQQQINDDEGDEQIIDDDEQNEDNEKKVDDEQQHELYNIRQLHKYFHQGRQVQPLHFVAMNNYRLDPLHNLPYFEFGPGFAPKIDDIQPPQLPQRKNTFKKIKEDEINYQNMIDDKSIATNYQEQHDKQEVYDRMEFFKISDDSGLKREGKFKDQIDLISGKNLISIHKMIKHHGGEKLSNWWEEWKHH